METSLDSDDTQDKDRVFPVLLRGEGATLPPFRQKEGEWMGHSRRRPLFRIESTAGLRVLVLTGASPDSLESNLGNDEFFD
jgi:hypothetical protein